MDIPLNYTWWLLHKWKTQCFTGTCYIFTYKDNTNRDASYGWPNRQVQLESFDVSKSFLLLGNKIIFDLMS